MKKIPSLFQRNYDGDRLVRNEVVPGSEWVINGEGVARQKYDGTACMIKDGQIYKRYDAKNGKTPPPDFIPCQEPDEKTGHWPGWVPCKKDDPADKYFAEVVHEVSWRDGTYELVGPRINGNPEKWDIHVLLSHANAKKLTDCPRDFEGIKAYLKDKDIEGVVWHHPDGRMVKIKKKDFGFKR